MENSTERTLACAKNSFVEEAKCVQSQVHIGLNRSEKLLTITMGRIPEGN